MALNTSKRSQSVPTHYISSGGRQQYVAVTVTMATEVNAGTDFFVGGPCGSDCPTVSQWFSDSSEGDFSFPIVQKVNKFIWTVSHFDEV